MYEDVLGFLVEQLEDILSEDGITEDTSMDDLRLDSLDITEIAMMLAEEFDLDDMGDYLDTAMSFENVGQAAEYVAKMLGE